MYHGGLVGLSMKLRIYLHNLCKCNHATISQHYGQNWTWEKWKDYCNMPQVISNHSICQNKVHHNLLWSLVTRLRLMRCWNVSFRTFLPLWKYYVSKDFWYSLQVPQTLLSSDAIESGVKGIWQSANWNTMLMNQEGSTEHIGALSFACFAFANPIASPI